MYGHAVQILPYGVVGGKLFGGYYHGQVTAKMAQRILMGEKVRDIHVIIKPQTQYMFNYEQLKRWGIKASDLPEDSIVINKPYSFYKENKVLIWCIIVVIIFQMLIIISLIMNITRRKKAEKELIIGEDKFKKLVEYLPVAIAILDKNENTEYANRKYEETIGYTSERTNVADWFLIAYPDEEYRKWVLEKWNADVEKALREGKEIEPSEYNVTCKDGKVRVMEISGTFVADKMITLFNDITERKQTEEALRESEERFRQVVESAEEWVWEMDSSVLYTYASPVVEKLLGYKPEEIVGKKHLYDLIHTDDRDAMEKEILELFAGKEQFFRFLNRNVHKNGHIVWLSTSGLPIIDEKGKLLGYRGTDIDITEQKQAEEELAKHHGHLEEVVKERTSELEKRVSEVEQLNSAMVNLMEDLRISNESLKTKTHQLANTNKELEAFSYSVSHDLRASLRSVDGFSQILLEDYSDTIDEKGKHYLERARAGTQKMGQLIDDILNLSRIGRQAMKMNKINMKSIAREVYNSLEDEWKGRKVDFNVHKCPSAAADLNLIKIVFMNLLSNALKFTGNRKEAKIEVGSETKDEQTVFFVKDNGVGFDMKYAEKLFSPFQRLHRVEEYEGTGIGLAIVQRIIHRHGGRIWVESTVGKGTTFYFTV